MLPYNDNLKFNARQLRRNMTDAEQVLWARLRKKQLLGVQFYRQKPIGRHIVDFFAPKAKLVVEVDGSQHFLEDHVLRDKQRDIDLSNLGLLVLRFNNLQVLRETDAVIEIILSTLSERLKQKIPPTPLYERGDVR